MTTLSLAVRPSPMRDKQPRKAIDGAPGLFFAARPHMLCVIWPGPLRSSCCTPKDPLQTKKDRKENCVSRLHQVKQVVSLGGRSTIIDTVVY